MMEKLSRDVKLCLICMDEHGVDTVKVTAKEKFMTDQVTYLAIYDYCRHADAFLETEEMIKANTLAMKDAYNKSK